MADRYDALVVGARAAGAATALLLARAGARVLVVERDAPGTDTLSTHALMRGGVMQLARWGLLDRVIAAGTPPVRTTLFAYGAERITVEIKPRPGDRCALQPAAHGARPDPRRAPPSKPAPPSATRPGSWTCCAPATAGCTARSSAPPTAWRRCGPASSSAPTAAARAWRARSRRRYVTPGSTPPPASTPTSTGIADRGNRWHYAPGAAAGVIPTNDGLHVRLRLGAPGPLPRAGARRPRGRARARARRGRRRARRRGRRRPPRLAAARLRRRARLAARRARPGLGAGRRRRLLQGPDHRARPDRRAARRRAARDAPSSPAPTGRSPATRRRATRCRCRLFRATDAIAALPRDMAALQALHRELHEAMRAEQDWLAAAALPAAA